MSEKDRYDDVGWIVLGVIFAYLSADCWLALLGISPMEPRTILGAVCVLSMCVWFAYKAMAGRPK